jgi:hypothetical protein
LYAIPKETTEKELLPQEKPLKKKGTDTMKKNITTTPDWLNELLAFRDDDISDCPEMTGEQLARMDFAKKANNARPIIKNRLSKVAM